MKVCMGFIGESPILVSSVPWEYPCFALLWNGELYPFHTSQVYVFFHLGDPWKTKPQDFIIWGKNRGRNDSLKMFALRKKPNYQYADFCTECILMALWYLKNQIAALGKNWTYRYLMDSKCSHSKNNLLMYFATKRVIYLKTGEHTASVLWLSSKSHSSLS